MINVLLAVALFTFAVSFPAGIYIGRRTPAGPPRPETGRRVPYDRKVAP